MQTDLGIISQRLINNEQALSEFKTNTNSALQAISTQLSQTTAALQNQLSGVSSSMEARMRPQYGTMATVAGLALAVLGMFVIQPMQRNIDDLRGAQIYETRDRVQEIKDLRNNTVSEVEHQRLLLDLREQRTQLVSRSEHEQHWTAEKAQLEFVRGDIKRLETQQAAVYSAGDLLRDLQHQVHELQSQRGFTTQVR